MDMTTGTPMDNQNPTNKNRLTDQERTAMLAFDAEISRAKARALDAKTEVEQAEAQFLGALTILANVRGITRPVKLSPDGGELIEV